MPHHAQPIDLVALAVAVLDDPVAADQLGGDAAGVDQGDRVCECIPAGRRVGMVVQIARGDRHADVVLLHTLGF